MLKLLELRVSSQIYYEAINFERMAQNIANFRASKMSVAHFSEAFFEFDQELLNGGRRELFLSSKSVAPAKAVPRRTPT